MFLLHDGMPADTLQALAPRVFELIAAKGGAMSGPHQKVRFCGMVSPEGFEPTFFLPKGVTKTAMRIEEPPEVCKTVMRALARYGNESRKHHLQDGMDNGSTDFLSVIGELAEDFRTHGYFTERQRVHSRNGGKPDWPRTLKHRLPMGTSVARSVYPDIITTRTVDSRETVLGSIHAAVMREICDLHDWWLDGLTGRKGELKGVPAPGPSRHLWAAIVRRTLTALYSARSIRLAHLLIRYLEIDRGLSARDGLYGLRDFHAVWERMLVATLPGVIEGMNANLPHACFRPRDSSATDVNRFMKTDVIARDAGTYYLLDAKYYDAQDSGTLPGWGDIAKQLVYEQALKTTIGPTRPIVNAFVFPSEVTQFMPYGRVEMVDRSGFPSSAFPVTEIYGLDIVRVMTCYASGTWLESPSTLFPSRCSAENP